VLIWRYLVLHSAMLWFSRDIQPYTEITTQAWYSSCSVHVSHHAPVIPIAGLYVPAVRTLDIPSSRNMWAKASSSLLLSSELLLLVVQFLYFTLGWATYIPLPLLVLTSWGRHYTLLIISEEAVYTTWWLTGTAIYLKQRLPSSPPCVEISSACFMPRGAHSYHYFPDFITVALLPLHCRGLFVGHAGCISLRLL